MCRKSKHIPKKSKGAHIIRCILLSIEEGTLLSYEMCSKCCEKNNFYAFFKLLEGKNIIMKCDDKKEIVESTTTDFIINDYEQYRHYITNSFLLSIERITKLLISVL